MPDEYVKDIVINDFILITKNACTYEINALFEALCGRSKNRIASPIVTYNRCVTVTGLQHFYDPILMCKVEYILIYL